MESETEVHTQIPVISSEDLPKISVDCNGINKDKEQNSSNTTNLMNVNGKDDPDGSYVFVSRSNSPNGDPIHGDLNVVETEEGVFELVPKSKDVEGGKTREFNYDNNCIDEGTAVPPFKGAVKLNVGEVDVLKPQDENAIEFTESEGKIEGDYLGSDLVVENGEAPSTVLQDGEIESDEQTGDSEVTLELGEVGESKEEANLESIPELREVPESKIVGLDTGDLHDPELTAGFKEGEEAQVVILEGGGLRDLLIDDGMVVDSNEEADMVATTEVEANQDNESKLAEVEIGKVNPGKQSELESPIEVEESLESQITASEPAESESFHLDNGEVKLEVESAIQVEKILEFQITTSEPAESESFHIYNEDVKLEEESPIQVEKSLESEFKTLEPAESESFHIDNGEVKLEEESPIQVEKNLESQITASEPAESESFRTDNGEVKLEEESPIQVEKNLESQITTPEPAESESFHNDNGEVKLEEECPYEVKKSLESQITTPEPAESESFHIDNREVKLEESPIEVKKSLESQITTPEPAESESVHLDNGELVLEESSPVEVEKSLESQITTPEPAASESFHLDNNGEVKLEEEKTDINATQESQLVVTDNSSSAINHGSETEKLVNETDVPLETEIADVHVLDEIIDSCPSSQVEDSKLNSNEEADMVPTTEVECSQDSESKLPDVEIGKLISEEQSGSETPIEVKESLESQITTLEPAESESFPLDNGEVKLEEEEKIDLTTDSMEYQESQPVVTDNINSAINQVNETEKLANETDIPLEAEIANKHVSDENTDSCSTSRVEDGISLTKVLNEPVDGSQTTTELNAASDYTRPEIKFGSVLGENQLSCPVKDAKLEVEVKNDTVEGDKISSCNEVNSETDIGIRSIDPEGNKVTCLSCADVTTESEVSNGFTDCAGSQPFSVNCSDPEYHASNSLQNGILADMKSESEVKSSSSLSKGDVTCDDAAVSRSDVPDGSVDNCRSASEALVVQDVCDQVNGGHGDDYENLTCQETKDTDLVHRDEISASSREGSSADALDEQTVGAKAVKMPYPFLIKIPKYDDEKLRDKIRHAQLQVEEKTQQREAIQVEIQMIRNNFQKLKNNYGVVKAEERAARGLVKSKRQEIDSVQSVINRVKNAVSVEDIDVRIQNMEHMMQHETLPLKEEKQFIREIKRLKQLREQLSSNMGSQDEVQQAMDQRGQIEEQLKCLKKELDCLKDKVSKAEAIALAAEKQYSDESKKLKELYAQHEAANGIRQEAYAHLYNLRSQLNEKNTRFWNYKDESNAAKDYALSGDKEALHRLCVNQVETVMELWNKNDEFRKEYVRCNTRSTLRRLRTLDGRALGPEEESPVLPNVVNERMDRSLSTPGKAKSELLISNLEPKKLVLTGEVEETADKSMAKRAEKMGQTEETKRPVKPTLRNGPTTVSGRGKTEELPEEEHKQTKEERELARKEEELRKEEAAAKLREQRRLEEKAKAKEAIERKRRNAEKAQIRAELRAQKEAEQKEKEREKKARKKEKKKAGEVDAPDGNNDGETIPSSEFPVVATKEPEIKESPTTTTTTKRPQKFTKQSKTKSIPPPLRNKGKRRMQQWIWAIFMFLLVLALFLLGNIVYSSNLAHNFRRPSSGF